MQALLLISGENRAKLKKKKRKEKKRKEKKKEKKPDNTTRTTANYRLHWFYVSCYSIERGVLN